VAEVVFLIPTFNEERTIIDVLRRAEPFADLLVVVDDGSRDSSGDLIEQWCETHRNVALLTHRRNQGMSGALRTGFSYLLELLRDGTLAADAVVVTMDADGQHNPEETAEALRTFAQDGADVLLLRRDFSGYPRYKRVGNGLLSWWAGVLSGYPFRDVECGFRLMRLNVIADIMPFFTGRAYGCAQELGILPVRRGWRMDNTCVTNVAYYRQGARMRDGVTNALMGLRAFLRVTFGLRGAVAVDPAEFRVTCVPELAPSTAVDQ